MMITVFEDRHAEWTPSESYQERVDAADKDYVEIREDVYNAICLEECNCAACSKSYVSDSFLLCKQRKEDDRDDYSVTPTGYCPEYHFVFDENFISKLLKK